MAHNPNLPAPADVLLINPDVIFFDEVESIRLGLAKALWTPKPEHFYGFQPENIKMLPSSIAPEVFSQLAGYTAAHGMMEPKQPLLLASDEIRWRRIVCLGDTVEIEVNTDSVTDYGIYRANGVLKKAGETACYGTITGLLFSTIDRLNAGLELTNRELESNRGTVTSYKKADPSLTNESEDEIIQAELKLLDGNQVELDGRNIRLSSVSRFILGSLIDSRDRFVTAKEIYMANDFPSQASKFALQGCFSTAKNTLRRQLVVGNPPKSIVTQKTNKSDRRQYFQINPGVDIK